MFKYRFRPDILDLSSRIGALVISLLVFNVIFNVIANASFKMSAQSSNWRGFLTWQVIGNMAGLITVLTLTGLLRFIPLHVAFPVTTGLTVIAIQVFASRMIFNEQISLAHWLGTLLVTVGIVFLTYRWQ
jgi:multidrug transporter EmrE-like cation transporter